MNSEQNNQNNVEEQIDEEQEVQEEKQINFSKNSIVSVCRKAGIKCISQDGIDKIRELLNNKIKNFAERLCVFSSTRNGKTMNKKSVGLFLESEGINITSNNL